MKKRVKCIKQDYHGILQLNQCYEVLHEYQGYNNIQYRILEKGFEYYYDDYLFINV